jgi:hypothetical protein
MDQMMLRRIFDQLARKTATSSVSAPAPCWTARVLDRITREEIFAHVVTAGVRKTDPFTLNYKSAFLHDAQRPTIVVCHPCMDWTRGMRSF